MPEVYSESDYYGESAEREARGARQAEERDEDEHLERHTSE